MAMTVGELRDHLERFPADLEIVMQTQVMEWRAIARVDKPCGDADRVQQGVCLVPGEGLAQSWR